MCRVGGLRLRSKVYIKLMKIHKHLKVTVLPDVQPYDSGVLHLSIPTKTNWWHQLFSNGGNLFVHLIDRSRLCIRRF